MARKKRAAAKPAIIQTCHLAEYYAALYIRLSVEDTNTASVSIDSQRMIMEDYIDRHPEIVGYELYIDNGLTGRHFDRPAFQTMLNDIELGRVNCVITKDLSRLGRNCIDTGYYIEKYFLMRGVRYIAINEGFDTAEHPDGDTGMMVPILNMLNEAFSRDIGRKVKASCDQRMTAGDYVGGRAPYGYRKSPDNCRRLLVDPESAPVVQMIFAWAAEGVALNEIAVRLNEAKILTPSRYAASRGIIAHKKLMSDRWQTRTVGKILSTELYTGDMVQGKSVSVDRKQRPNDPENWVRVPNTHEPIISHNLFDTVQAVRAATAQKWTKKPAVPFTDNILKGKIFCGHCGKSLHRQRSNNKYQYRCISNDRIAKDACAGKIYLPETALFEMILTILYQESEAIAGKSPLTGQAETTLCSQRKELQHRLSQARSASDTGKGYFRTLYESMVSGIITTQEYKTMKAEYEEKIKQAAVSARALERRITQVEQELQQVRQLPATGREIAQADKLTAPLVEQFIDRITVYDAQTVEIRFRFEDVFALVKEVCGHGGITA